MKQRRILNYVGSKWSLADWIISHMPSHDIYLEPYFGSGAVFFNKLPSLTETINDIDGNVVNLFKIIREQPHELANLIKLTPYAREEYYSAYNNLSQDNSDLEQARLFLVRCWMARGGKTAHRTGWRHNADGRTISALPDWHHVPESIVAIADRLLNVQIENMDAITLIQRYNKTNCLIYADPPYVLSTRTNKHYANEMTLEEHRQMLLVLKEHDGYVLISGYEHPLYDEILQGWHKVNKSVMTDAAISKDEILYINPKAYEDCQLQLVLEV